jgi:predicted ester cyclase
VSTPDFDTLSTRRTIDRLFDAAAGGDVDRVLEWWAPDGVLDDVTLATRYAGHAELGAYLEMYYRAFEDLEFRPVRIVVDGAHAAVEWAQTFRLTGDFAGLHGDDREIRARGLDVFEVRNGRVVTESGWYGDGWLMDRLSAPDPTSLPDPLPRGTSWSEVMNPDPRPPTTSAETRAVIDRLFAEAETGNTERVLRWWAPAGVLDDVTIARRYTSHAELGPYLDMYYKAFPDLTFKPSLLIVDGPWALVQWAETCHFRGPFDGIQPDGRRLQIRAVDTFVVENELVQAESSWYGDGWFRARLESREPDSLRPPLPEGDGW